MIKFAFHTCKGFLDILIVFFYWYSNNKMGNDNSSPERDRSDRGSAERNERSYAAQMYYAMPQSSHTNYNFNIDAYKSAKSIHQFGVRDINGQVVKLKTYKGNVCLIVNFSTEVGAATYINKFNRLLKMFANLRILAFPCNQFSGNTDLTNFFKTHNPKFNVFGEVFVNGPNADPLWKFLKKEQENGTIFMKEILEDFTMFLVDIDGVPVQRYEPPTDPLDLVPELEAFSSKDTADMVFVKTSVPKTTNNKPKEVKESKKKGDYDCVTCHNRFGLQIYQCSTGHSSCKDCKLRGAKCGICRQNITDMRNITLETLISDIQSPCENASHGCSLSFKLGDMSSHLRECPFGQFVCPMVDQQCSWKGPVPQLEDHFKNVHPDNVKARVNSEMFLFNICNEYSTLQFLKIGSFNFLIHLKVGEVERKIFMTVQLIGSKVSAAKWYYELHVYNKGEPQRKFMYKDVCNSHSTPVDQIFQQSNCAVLTLPYAMTFLQEGCLNYKISISKADDVPTRQQFRGARRRN